MKHFGAVVVVAFVAWGCGGASSSAGAVSSTGSTGTTSSTGMPATATSAGTSGGASSAGSSGASSGGTSGGVSSGSSSGGASTGGPCLDTQTDPGNCGACGHACPEPDSGLVACVAGACGDQVTLMSSSTILDFAVDDTSVYWRDLDGGLVSKSPLQGGSIETLAHGLSFPDDFLSGSSCDLPVRNPGIAVDEGVVYFAINNGLGSVDVDGGGLDLPVGELACTVTGLLANGTTLDIVCDSGGDTSATAQTLAGGAAVSLPGSAQYGGMILAAYQSNLAIAESYAFNITPSYAIVLDTDVGSLVLAQSNEEGCAWGVALDANDAYVAVGGAIQRIAFDGGTTVLASGFPFGVAVDSTDVYWTDLTAGTVMKTATDGGPALMLASGLSDPVEVAVDATSVYVLDSLGLRRITPK